MFFRAQTGLTDELQKELCHRLGQLTGKPKENYLHIHPLNNFNDDLDKNLNVITSDQAARPAEDIFRNSAERPLGARGGWHTDIGYEPHSADYTVLKLTQLPESGGGVSILPSIQRIRHIFFYFHVDNADSPLHTRHPLGIIMRDLRQDIPRLPQLPRNAHRNFRTATLLPDLQRKGV